MAQSEVGTRIRLAREKAGLSQAKLGERVGKTGNQIGKYERGESRPHVEMVALIAEAVNKPLSFLLEYAIEEEPRVAEPPIDPYGNVPVDPSLRLVPYVECWDGAWPLPKDVRHWYVQQELLVHGECLITRLGRDDQSMRPFLLPGDAFLVDPHVRRPRSMAVVMLHLDGKTLVRRFKRSGNTQAYVPMNPCYPSLEATGKEKILGQVVGVAARRLHNPLTFELGCRL